MNDVVELSRKLAELVVEGITDPAELRLLPPRSPIIPRRRLRTPHARFQQVLSAKSAEQVFEIQSQYAKKAYDAYIAEASKLSEMWVDLARDAYERVVAK